MPIRYETGPDDIILSTWEGEVSADELATHWRVLLSDPDALRLRRSIADLRRATLRFTGEELRGLVNAIVVPMLAGRRWRTALVTASDENFGVSRQYQVFASYYSQDAIFRDLESARRWLLEAPVDD